jgi:transposase
MAHLHKKIKKGRPYYYVREIRRVDGKPKVVSQIYLGSVAAIAQRFRDAAVAQRPVRLQAREFGALFLAHEIEKRLDTIGIVDRIVPRAPREKGPTVGEYFFYAWANRLIDPKSKRALPDWYRGTAVDQIRPVDVNELTSQRYWEKWSRVSAAQVEQIGRAFFERVWQLEPLPPECLLFDTTNYYSYMASQTPSELAQRGHNKDSKHHLRQVGLALLVDRATALPLYYRAYEGNVHDAALFRRIVDELFGVMCGFNQTKQRLTVVFDKGINSDAALAAIGDQQRIHFITTYSTYFADELAATDLKRFAPLAGRTGGGDEEDRKLAFRARAELWGQERTVIVTYNPKSARKKSYTLDQKLETVREALLEYRRLYREQAPQWRSPEALRERYLRLCEQLHIGGQYYELEFTGRTTPEMGFRKDHYQRAKAEALFGKNIIVTDNHDWTTEEIVQASLDRVTIEQQFRASKAPQHVSVNPLFHWTDGKIRCQLLTCVIALTASRLLERAVNPGDTIAPLSARTILDEMRRLHSVWLWRPGQREPQRLLETPTETHAAALRAFGWDVGGGGVLQPRER